MGSPYVNPNPRAWSPPNFAGQPGPRPDDEPYQFTLSAPPASGQIPPLVVDGAFSWPGDQPIPPRRFPWS
jgi:hypothetical protein